MRRCLLALALSVLALGAQPAAAEPPKQPVPLEMSGIADMLEVPPVDTTGTNESDDGSDGEPVANDPASTPAQQSGNEAQPAETGQQSEPNPAAAQPNDSSSDEAVVAPAADPSAPQAEVTAETEPEQAAEPEAVPANNADTTAGAEPQQAAEPEAVPANNADTTAGAEPQPAAEPEAVPANDTEPQQAAEPEAVPANNADTSASASPAPASQSAAAGQSAEQPNTTKAPAIKRVRALQVWDADQGGEPSATAAVPPPSVGDTAPGAGVIAVPLREPDLVPPHAGGLPTLLPIELISEISLEELAAGPISEPEASRPAPHGVAAASVVRTERPAAKADRPKAAAQRPAKTGPGLDQPLQNVPKTAPTRPDVKSAPTARRGPDFITAAQRAAPGTAMNPDRPPWLITLLALLATAVSLAAITVIVLRPHLFGRKSVPPAPRPHEPESSRNEQAGIRYRE